MLKAYNKRNVNSWISLIVKSFHKNIHIQSQVYYDKPIFITPKRSQTKNYISISKSLIPTFNTYFSNKQYPFRILYLSTQIQMVFVYRNYSFKRVLKDYRCTNINNHQICLIWQKKRVYKLKTQIPRFRYVFIVISNKSDARLYNSYQIPPYLAFDIPPPHTTPDKKICTKDKMLIQSIKIHKFTSFAWHFSILQIYLPNFELLRPLLTRGAVIYCYKGPKKPALPLKRAL